MKNSYKVQIGGDKGILVNPGSTIEDWGPGSSENIVIDLDGDGGETTVGSGTQVDPYTVEDAAIKVDEVSTWVTGYILGSSSKTKSLGGASKDNIVLATVAGETDESKWIIVDLVGSAVQAKLDIVADATLIGKKVKVQGNIVKNIFGGALAMTVIVAQEGGSEGGVEPEPTGNLLFPGSDFNTWSTFLASLNSFGLKEGYTSQNATGGREGSSALHLNGTPAGNDYVFTGLQASGFTATPSKIVFYIKGTAAKSLSFNVYLTDKTFKAFNLDDCSGDKTLEVFANNQ